MNLPAGISETIRFSCNLCGTANDVPLGGFHREIASCHECNSTPRFRGIVYALSVALFHQPIRLDQFPVDKRIRGIGMSDWEGYAAGLARALNYTNTFYHAEPRLDVTDDEDWKKFCDLDFMICSEVFEHIVPPVERGFRNLRRMMKTGGTMIFSVPYTNAPSTTEHFPGLHKYVVQKFEDKWIVLNRTKTGTWEVYEDVLFHGGPGTTLEMRVYAEGDLMHHLRGAQFSIEKVYSEPVLDIGYYWPLLYERQHDIGYPHLAYIIEAKAA
jgi:hypothetical protein